MDISPYLQAHRIANKPRLVFENGLWMYYKYLGARKPVLIAEDIRRISSIVNYRPETFLPVHLRDQV